MLNILQAESVLCLVQERQDPQARINPTISPSSTSGFEVPDANIIIRSSDLVDFRIHKSVLAMTSPFFEDLLSLPQPSDSENLDGLPVIQLSEDSELLSCLVSILYPVPTVIPSSYEKVLYLLANWSVLISNPFTTRCYAYSPHARNSTWSQCSRLSAPRSATGNSQRQREPRPSLPTRLRAAKNLSRKWKMQPARP